MSRVIAWPLIARVLGNSYAMSKILVRLPLKGLFWLPHETLGDASTKWSPRTCRALTVVSFISDYSVARDTSVRSHISDTRWAGLAA